MFGEELILRRPYTYKYNIDGLTREITLASEDKAYKDFIYWWSWNIKHNGKVKFEIIEDNNSTSSLYYSKFYLVEQAFNSKSLAENAYTGPEYKIKFEDGSLVKISSGMKPMKIVSKFIDKFGTQEDKEMFERFRIWHSQLLNQKSIDGELCLSIHPLDFMTMSDNNNGWSSCMHWTNKYGDSDPGDYRAGTVDCMNSPYIIIAYLHNNKHPFKLNDGWEWNSKRWRELFIINEGSITEIKGYPYQDENLTNTCLMWIKELAEKNLGWTYDDEEVNMKQPYESDGVTFYFDYIKPQYMYKDIGSLDKHAGRINKKVLFDKSKHRNQYFITPEAQEKNIFIDIPYGGESTCMCCGGIRDEEGADKAVFCSRCDSVLTCACCGGPLYDEDNIYWIDDYDAPYCYDCWCEQTTMDDLTEESHLTDDMTEIRLMLGYDKYENPLFYNGKILMVYEPQYNWSYQEIFNAEPKRIKDGWCAYDCVTIDMINPKKYQECMNIFDNPDDDELYPDKLYYLPDMTLAYPEDEEN